MARMCSSCSRAAAMAALCLRLASFRRFHLNKYCSALFSLLALIAPPRDDGHPSL